MAGTNVLERYGIKEVADVTFYKIDESGNHGAPVLFLDTLKVSTIEQTAENTSARGGKGNPEIIMWDYGKEINVTLEDALFSAKSMAVMFGDADNTDNSVTSVLKTVRYTATSADTSASTVKVPWDKPDGTEATSSGGTFYDITTGVAISSTASLTSGTEYFYTFNLATTGVKIDITPDTFPGTYYITGDTYARSETTGEDEFFQFVIPKAKVLSENTLTMEAEGDPSTFSMNLRVMKPKTGSMMQLIKYDVSD